MLKFNFRKILIVLAVVLSLVFLHYMNVLNPVERLVLNLTQPVSENLYKLGSSIKNTYSRQLETRDKTEEIEELRSRANQLLAENAKLRTVKEENRILRSYLDFLDEDEYGYVLANVVSQEVAINPQAEQANMVIDRGSRDGVEPGLLVVNDEGLVVGKVSKVGPSSSGIALVTSDDCQIASSIQNPERTSGVVEGRLGLTMDMNFIPQSEEVSIGDLVLTSGLERRIPKGMVIGEVIEVDSSRNEVWQKAIIESPVDFSGLSVVSVLIP